MMPTGKLSGSVFDGIQDVSILVLLDDAYRHDVFIKTITSSNTFQSLFFWMMPTGRPAMAIRLPPI